LARAEKERDAALDEKSLLEQQLAGRERKEVSAPEATRIDAILADLESVTRERNDLAAELASIRASAPPEPSTPRRTRRTRERAPEVVADAPELITRCPQFLTEVVGLDPRLQGLLYAAGIGTYWQLAKLSDQELGEILAPADGEGPFNLEKIRAEALQLASETESVGRVWNGQKPDDFGPLLGNGAGYERQLYDAGICTYESLAETSIERLEKICPGTAARKPDYAQWVEEARARAEAGQG
jgi:predicted flap endonuclease-1-like 5' DNA nuclease